MNEVERSNGGPLTSVLMNPLRLADVPIDTSHRGRQRLMAINLVEQLHELLCRLRLNRF